MKNFLSKIVIFAIILATLIVIVLFALAAAPRKVAGHVTDRVDCPIYAPCPSGYKNKNRK